MMPEYSSSESTSLSSGTPRVRQIRLVRPTTGSLPVSGLTVGRHGPGFGFSVRGGREHGTGFFVSHVEDGSEAQIQGLREGDQIVRVNGFQVEDAVHKELLQLISHQTRLKLKVRGVGMIPIRERATDPLTWQIVPDQSPTPPTAMSRDLEEHVKTVKMSVAPRAKLGCGICKGPEWKPGIFVQFTKENGIAREAGLRPGDQIIKCNGVDFDQIPFNEAVNVLKQSRDLELLVRPGAGSELFPSESSGYNSSASSVTGDQSPSCQSKRLSIVKEELDLEDRFGHFRPKSWDRIDLDWRHDSQNNYDNIKNYDKLMPLPQKIHHSDQKNCTIINLSENGTTINNTSFPNQDIDNINTTNKILGQKLADICLVSTRQSETKTVLVEVHRSDLDSISNVTSMEHQRNPMEHQRNPSISSVASGHSGISLSSAISEEIKRRAERSKSLSSIGSSDSPIPPPEPENKKKLINSLQGPEHAQRHDALMNEFKRAHRKMFSGGNTAEPNAESIENIEAIEPDRNQQRVPSSISDRRSLFIPRELPQDDVKHLRRGSHGPPPPPPPMPAKEQPQTFSPTAVIPPPPFMTTAKHQEIIKPKIAPPTKPKAPAPPPPQLDRPPSCPTPDYDNISIASEKNHITPEQLNFSKRNLTPTATKMNTKLTNGSAKEKASSDAVEMESLESFKLNNPASPRPKPPQTYFHAQLAGTATMRKTQRPVSVTIGEYPSGVSRREPSKFDFIARNSLSGSEDGDTPITSRFQSELVQTLSRSNLKKRTESMENLLNGGNNVPNGTSHNNIKNTTNGTVKISLNSTVNGSENINESVASRYTKNLPNNKINGLSTNTMDKIANAISNKVTINIANNKIQNTELNGKMEVRKSDSMPPSGILKNGTNHITQFNYHRPVAHQKSITFGKM